MPFVLTLLPSPSTALNRAINMAKTTRWACLWRSTATLLIVIGLTACTQPLTDTSTAHSPDRAESSPSLKPQSLPPIATPDTGSNSSPSVPRSLPTHHVSLTHFVAPPTLAGLTLSGEISSEHTRSWRYNSEDEPSNVLYIVLSNLPSGWEDMSHERAISSFYSEIRQRRIDRALRVEQDALTIVQESLFDLEGEPSAQAQMHWLEGNKPVQYQSLLMTRLGPVFIRVNNASYQQNTRWLLQQTKRALAEFRAAQTLTPTQ